MLVLAFNYELKSVVCVYKRSLLQKCVIISVVYVKERNEFPYGVKERNEFP